MTYQGDAFLADLLALPNVVFTIEFVWSAVIAGSRGAGSRGVSSFTDWGFDMIAIESYFVQIKLKNCMMKKKEKQSKTVKYLNGIYTFLSLLM